MLVLLAEGRSNAQIAAALYISPKTASVHVSNILAKIGAANRTEAAAPPTAWSAGGVLASRSRAGDAYPTGAYGFRPMSGPVSYS
ncbi:hypothetical protein GCM10020218_076620 [Dactylosporangium vinaceum]